MNKKHSYNARSVKIPKGEKMERNGLQYENIMDDDEPKVMTGIFQRNFGSEEEL
jgi:hypothetical protein